MKNLGYHHSTLAGLTVGIADIPVVEDKAEIIEESHKRCRTNHKTIPSWIDYR